jgi:group I intron endonuclease
MKAGVYAIRNVETGECYVGSSVDVPSRWRHHRKTLRRNCSKHPPLQLAWDKYREDGFEFLVLEEIADISKLIEREQFWIEKLDALRRGYNSAPSAGPVTGIIRSAKTRARMSKPKSDEHREKMRQPKSPEHRAKLSEALRKRWARGEFKDNPHVGMKRSAEARANISRGKIEAAERRALDVINKLPV